VVVFTRPDVIRGLSSYGPACPYDRIVGMWQQIGEGVRHFMLYDEDPISERRIQLTATMSRRLMRSMLRLYHDEVVNCHKFSRIMSGVALENGEQDFEPLTNAPIGPGVTGMKLGEVGVISTNSVGVLHSMVGLGAENPDSLQVMSIEGELGLCSNKDMLDFYEQLFAEESQLHAVPTLRSRGQIATFLGR